jgi:hypothetical protein
MEQTMKAELNHDVAIRRTEVARVCAQLGVRRLELFGSAARGGPARDLDFLVDLGERTPVEYARAYFALRERLAELFGRSVDLVTPPGLRNPYFRQRVEQEKILLYAA